MKKFILLWVLLWIVVVPDLDNKSLKVLHYGVHDGKLRIAYKVKDPRWSVRLWVFGENEWGFPTGTTFCDIIPISPRGSYEETHCVVPTAMEKVKLSF